MEGLAHKPSKLSKLRWSQLTGISHYRQVSSHPRTVPLSTPRALVAVPLIPDVSISILNSVLQLKIEFLSLTLLTAPHHRYVL